jgi:S1-C subfamily serine protease
MWRRCLLIATLAACIGCADKHPPAQTAELAVVGIALNAGATPIAQGFFVSADGFLVTCAHAVRGSKTAAVSQAGKPTLTATLVESDNEHDVALLKVAVAPPNAVPWLALHTGDIEANQHVRAVTLAGVVHGRFDHWENFGRDIAFTGHIDRAACGAPLVGDDGAVVGIMRSTLHDRPDQDVAVPIWVVLRMMPTLAPKPSENR